MILVTFAHQIADGRGALQAAHDLAAVLEGTILSAGTMPESQEVLLANDATPPAPISVDASPAEPPADTDPAPAGTLRPFDATLPILQTAELTAEATRSLVQRAHEESCTVQAALCAAAATALFARSDRTHIRINVPVDLRAEVGNPRDVAIRFSGATVTLDRTPDTSFWMLAREAAGQLDVARRPQTLRAGALGLAAFAPTTPEAAEAAMLAATGADIEITNLGVARFEGSTVTAVWGPTMTTQVDGEQILGVVTQGGVLRMVNTTRTPLDGLVTQIAELLTSACHQRTGMVRE